MPRYRLWSCFAFPVARTTTLLQHWSEINLFTIPDKKLASKCGKSRDGGTLASCDADLVCSGLQ